MSGLSYYNLGQAPLPLPPDLAFAGAEPDVLAVDFSLEKLIIRDTVVPLNNFYGRPEDKLTVSRASGGGRVNGAGLYEWSTTNHTLRYEHDPLMLDSSATPVKIDKAGLKSFTTTGAVDYRNASAGWATATSYGVSERCYNAAGRSYVCLVAHVSSPATEPGVGAGWRAFWARAERAIRISDKADLANYLLGTVDSYADGLLVINVATISGSGVKSDWHVIEALGVRIEGARTNLVRGSDQLTTGWAANASPSRTLNAAMAPNGLMDAAEIIATRRNSGYYQNAVVPNGATVAVSTYIKYVAGVSPRVRVGTDFDYATFDLISGAVVSTSGTVLDAFSIQDRDGWRCYVAVVTNTRGSDQPAAVFFQSATETYPVTVNAWGVQVEADASASSYIPTEASAVTRAADNVRLTAADYTWSDAAGSSYVRFDLPPAMGTGLWYALSRGPAGRLAYTVPNPERRVRIYDGTTIVTAGIGGDRENRFAASFGPSGQCASLDGAPTAEGAYDGSMGAGDLYFGSLNGSIEHLNSILCSAKIIPGKQLTGTDLQKMSLAP